MNGHSPHIPGLASVILPVHNGMPYLPRAVESILGQTYPHRELLVVDDGSTDDTARYLNQLRETAIRVLPANHCGIVHALNAGLNAARGEYVVRQDADDISAPNRLEKQIGQLQTHPDTAVLACCTNFLDAQERETTNAWTTEVRRRHDPVMSHSQIRDFLPLTNCLAHGTICARTETLLAVRGYREEFRWAEDYDLWLRLLTSRRFAKLPDRLYGYRLHGGQVAEVRRAEQIRQTLRAKLDFVRRQWPGLPLPARTMVLGSGVGADCYRGCLAEFGMAEIQTRPNPSHPRDTMCWCLPPGSWDLLIVTQFEELEETARQLAQASIAFAREGNFFCALVARDKT